MIDHWPWPMGVEEVKAVESSKEALQDKLERLGLSDPTVRGFGYLGG